MKVLTQFFLRNENAFHPMTLTTLLYQCILPRTVQSTIYPFVYAVFVSANLEIKI